MQPADGIATYSMTVSYDGAPFSGFACQLGRSTVQGCLEEALALLFKDEIPTVCAGRTDAGVHALGQVVSFNVNREACKERSLDSLCRSLNALTPDEISVRQLVERPEGFSARFSAKCREYRYFIAVGSTPPIFMRAYSWHVRKSLDRAAMEAGAAHLIGEHDFKSFCLSASAEGKPTCRNVIEISFDDATIMGEPMLVVTVKGNAFLQSMVRTIVGTLVAVGKGQRPSGWVADVLAACDRRAAGECAPAQGLVFWSVVY